MLAPSRPRLKVPLTDCPNDLSEDSEVEAMVRSLFTVKDVFDRGEGSKEYSIVYEDRSKAAFKSLYPRVKPLGFTPRLFGTRDDASLTLVKGRDSGAPVAEDSCLPLPALDPRRSSRRGGSWATSTPRSRAGTRS